MQRNEDHYIGAGASQLWKLSGRLENLPQVIHMSDSKQIFNISCLLFWVIASEIDCSTKCHPCEIGCENKKKQVRRKYKRNIPRGISQQVNKVNRKSFTGAMSMPEAETL